MKSRWVDTDAALFEGDLGQLIYGSRLIGSDTSLVLHGGGNTSAKSRATNLYGEQEEILYIKGRGRDLATIDESGFSPCLLRGLLRMTELEALSDIQMEGELRLASIDPTAPAPSVETLLHALLLSKFVIHTHADALISIMNTPRGVNRIRKLYGNEVVVVPYCMPGFKLARLAREHWKLHSTDETVGMVLLHHGIFTFGPTAKSAYERMITLVDRAERYLEEHEAWTLSWPKLTQPSAKTRDEIATLRRAVSDTAGTPLIIATHTDEQTVGFAGRSDVADLSQRGGVTPDHVIWTKRVPLVGRDVERYSRDYQQYVSAHADGQPPALVDPAPRVIVDPKLGLCVAGKTAKDAAITEDIYRHTIDIIMRAEKLDGWRALPPRDFYDVEYWDMERVKLGRTGREPPLSGEVAVVTGGASGIGRACVDALLTRGAAVAALDLSPSICELHQRVDYLGLKCDLTREQDIDAALEAVVHKFGGVDMLVLNAGIFPKSSPIASLATEAWRKAMTINLDANLVLMRECYPLLKAAFRGGRVVIVGSKNVPAPGPGAASYSASKAALQQLARVAALEWGNDGIRVNTLHPNAVFDTGIWTPEVLAARAKSYGLTVEQYKTNNVLRTEVTSRDVAELAAELCCPVFAKTTGAQIPIDGGNDRVI